MKARAILAMAAGIIAVHLLVLYLVFFPGTPGETSGTADSPGNTSSLPTEKNGDAGSVPDKPDKPDQLNKPDDRPGKPDKMVRPASSVTPGPAPHQDKVQRYRTNTRPLKWKGAVKSIRGLEKSMKSASTGILVDLGARRVLWSKNPEKKVPLASLTKLMTLLLIYEQTLDPAEKLTLNTPVRVTPEAANVPPSGVALRTSETFPLEKLMLAAAVKSANDAAFLIAQTGGHGKAEIFVSGMNRRAKELGMKNTIFFNPHGLPGTKASLDNKSTAADLVKLCEAYLSYPRLRQWSAMPLASFRKEGDLRNHNHLLPRGRTACPGVSGIKTGFTNRAGFCVAAVCTREGRRLLAIVTGFPAARQRDLFTRSLLEWGFKQRR